MLLSFLVLAALPAVAQQPAPIDKTAELLAELIRVNTSNPPGNEQKIAELLAPRFKALGFEVDIIPTPDSGKAHFIARLRGDGSKRPLLIAAHADVVGVEREKWTKDPFAGTIEGGYVFGRGAIDFKGGLAVFARAAMMLAENKVRLARDVIFMAEADEESRPYNTSWLARTHWAKMDAEFALNEGGWGELDASGHKVSLDVEAGEKFPQNYVLEVTNPGGHSSRPVKNNAIYHLAAALTRIAGYDFPVQFNDANRAYFTGMAKIQAARGETAVANAMTAFLRDSNDAEALALVAARDPGWNATLRTTCVATMLDAGHATNALPQRARANINCRIFPGVSIEAVRAKLAELIADPEVTVKIPETRGPVSSPPPLTPAVLKPIEKLTAQFWPGVQVLPILQAGATDGEFTNAVGIPTYGVEPVFLGPDVGHIHGLNEYVGVKSLLEGREFLYRLVKIYAEQR